MPRSAGSCSFNSSNKSFISFLRLRSASLWDTRNSGDLEYGAELPFAMLSRVSGGKELMIGTGVYSFPDVESLP